MHRDRFGRWRAGKSPHTPKLTRLHYKRDGGIMDQLIGRIPAQDGTFATEDATSDANSLTPRSALLSARSTSTIMSASTQLSDSDSLATEREASVSAQKQRRKKTKRRWVSVFALLGWSNSPMFFPRYAARKYLYPAKTFRSTHRTYSTLTSSRAGD